MMRAWTGTVDFGGICLWRLCAAWSGIRQIGTLP